MDGHDIQIVGGIRGTGPLRLVCATRGCHSIPMDWILPSDEVLTRKATRDAPVRSELKLRPERRENLRDRWRKFAIHFLRAA